MTRSARLIAGAKWRSTCGGNHIVKGYARWFGVDPICAITELRILGVDVATKYEAQIRLTITARANARTKLRAEKLAAKTRPTGVEWTADWPIEWIPADEEDVSVDSIPF